MPTITIKLELHKPTLSKQEVYQKMTEINTFFVNWLLGQDEIKATSKTYKLYSTQKFPSAIANQTIREVISKKRARNKKV